MENAISAKVVKEEPTEPLRASVEDPQRGGDMWELSEPMQSSEKHLVGHPQLHRVLCRFVNHVDLLDLRLVSGSACYATDCFVADTTADFVLNGTESPISASRNACLLFVPLKVSRENDWFRHEIEPILATGWAETEQIVVEHQAKGQKQSLTPVYNDARQEGQSKLRRDQQRVIWGRIGWILHHALGSKGRLFHIRRWGGAEKVDALTCYSRALTLGAGDVESWCGLHEMSWTRMDELGDYGILLSHPILGDILCGSIAELITKIPGWQDDVRLCKVVAEHQAAAQSEGALMKSLLDTFPNDATVWAMNGYYRQFVDRAPGETRSPWVFFRRAISLDSRDFLIWLRLARTLQRSGADSAIGLRLSQHSSEEVSFTIHDCIAKAIELNPKLNWDAEKRTVDSARRVSVIFHEVV